MPATIGGLVLRRAGNEDEGCDRTAIDLCRRLKQLVDRIRLFGRRILVANIAESAHLSPSTGLDSRPDADVEAKSYECKVFRERHEASLL